MRCPCCEEESCKCTLHNAGQIVDISGKIPNHPGRFCSYHMKEISMTTFDAVREVMAAVINANAAATPEQELRQGLEANYPRDVYDTKELQEKFEVLGFMAPFVVVRRLSDGKKGSLEFTHRPRFYYGFKRSNP